MNFITEHWRVITIALIGVAFGVFLNHLARVYSNKRLLSQLTEELLKLQANTNLSEDDKLHIEYLKGEIYILKFKCSVTY